MKLSYILIIFKGWNANLGQNEDRCWEYDACNNKWNEKNETLNEKRKNAAGRVLPVLGPLFLGRERPWILGGEVPGISSTSVSSTTEYYTGSEWIKSEDEDLQEEKFGACATIVNIDGTVRSSDGVVRSSDGIVLIGGKKTFRQVESFLGEIHRNSTSIQAPQKNKKDGKKGVMTYFKKMRL